MIQVHIKNLAIHHYLCFFLPDTPGPPGLPEVIDYDENMVELKWDAPFRDGGAPITG